MIDVRRISFTYPDGIEVFRDISLSVNPGETLGITGPNGSGKTTLLLALSGLVECTGEIVIDGLVLNRKTIRDIRKKMSFVFQNPDDQLFMPHVEEDIAFGLDQLGYAPEEIETAVGNALESVGLPGFEERSGHHLSLGQKKRVCLAAAFARRPAILLLDEPSNELDPGGKRELCTLIRTFEGTKLIVSHDMNLIADLCDNVLVLNHGKIAAAGSVPRIMADSNIMEGNSLEVPYRFR